jgi:peptidyl-prolyl cis-trans isomerase B (cyclophilin B)
MTVGFRPDKAPNHVKNFVKLAKEGFYDGTKFHRVVKGFMIQGGCPNTREGAKGMPGTGNPGYSVNAEFNDIRHERGVLSMARSQDPNSAGSQFFVLHGTAPHLDNQYSAFGQLVSGLDTLDKIASVPVRQQPQGGETSAPVEPVHLHQAVVLPAFKP